MNKKVNGKSKGNTFERKIANLLSDKFKEYLGIEKGFRRNPDSGSFFGGKNQSRTETYGNESANFGDLICPEKFKFSVECKHYKQAPSFQSLIDGKIPDWDKWISQAMQDSIKSGKLVMLVIKYNNVEEIVITNTQLPTATIRYRYKDLLLYKLNDFLSEDTSNYFE